MAALKGLQNAATEQVAASYRDLTNEDLSLLASILSHQPPPTLPQSASQHKIYSKLTRADILKLPPHLRNYPGTVTKYLTRCVQDDIRAEYRELCSMHLNINRRLMHSMLHWVKKEIDVNIPAVVLSLAKANLLTAEYREQFRRLRESSGMWLRPETYHSLFNQDADPRWSYQNDRCPACILSRLGGEEDILVTLKAGLLVRCRSFTIVDSKRHGFVDALIQKGFTHEQAQEITIRSMKTGTEIKLIWKELMAKRQQDRKVNRTATAALVPAEVETDFNREGESTRDEKQSSALQHNNSEAVASWLNDISSANNDEEEDKNSIYREINDLIEEYRRPISHKEAPNHRTSSLFGAGQVKRQLIESCNQGAWNHALSYRQLLDSSNPYLGNDGDSPASESQNSPERTNVGGQC